MKKVKNLKRKINIFSITMLFALIIMGIWIYDYIDIAGALPLVATAILTLGILEINLPQNESLKPWRK